MDQLSVTSKQCSVRKQVKLNTAYRSLNTERGSSMAWTAVFLAFVVIPLMALVADGARLFYVRGRLQTATDAACEDAAWSAADRRVFRETGKTTFDDDWYIIALAQNTFNQSLSDQAVKQFSATVVISLDPASLLATCSSVANVPLMTTLGLAFSPVTIDAYSVSTIRFTR
ncbi:MAG: Tad domain-containing protein [Anaerolineales bacterium]|nr:Tad domain-containing protein [Anaerolineales bacterium]